MRNTKARMRLALLPVAGVLALGVTLLQAGAAWATNFSGNFNVYAPITGTYNTPMHETTSAAKVSSCVHGNTVGGSNLAWGFQIIWYDGGANKVLWRSADYSGPEVVCSPTVKLSQNNRVYDEIIVFNTGSGIESQLSGYWTLNNY